jgi:hypothetical protein
MTPDAERPGPHSPVAQIIAATKTPTTSRYTDRLLAGLQADLAAHDVRARLGQLGELLDDVRRGPDCWCLLDVAMEVDHLARQIGIAAIRHGGHWLEQGQRVA